MVQNSMIGTAVGDGVLIGCGGGMDSMPAACGCGTVRVEVTDVGRPVGVEWGCGRERAIQGSVLGYRTKTVLVGISILVQLNRTNIPQEHRIELSISREIHHPLSCTYAQRHNLASGVF